MKKIGIIAGAGLLPYEVMKSCQQDSIQYAICNFENETDKEELLNSEHQKIFKIHEISNLIRFLKAQKVTHVTLAGKFKRAEIKRLLLDSKGIKLFAKIIKNGLADNAILTAIIEFFENEGFEVIPPEKIAKNLNVEKGLITKLRPSKSDYDDIEYGLRILKSTASLDIGQSLIVQNKLVLGIEAAEGTDELIRRCKNLGEKGSKSILIKICKPTQDKRVDLPSIGPNTVRNAIENNVKGIAIESESSIFIDKDQALELANSNGIFIVGI